MCGQGIESQEDTVRFRTEDVDHIRVIVAIDRVDNEDPAKRKYTINNSYMPIGDTDTVRGSLRCQPDLG